MKQPKVSVIMPVYNSGAYLKEAIDSILQQTLTDFELIVVNDLSTDESEKIILSYHDGRLQHFINDRNKGVVDTTNFGISKARGQYICIMHADDIAMPQRLEKQSCWLDKNTSTMAVASYIENINERGEIMPPWQDDLDNNTANEIKATMVWRCCIAHPSVMLRKEVFEKYKYRTVQQSYEDHDLWLRMLADGMTIEKVPEKLLQYRVHSTSITGSILKKRNPFFTQYRCKKNFLALRKSEGKWGIFETRVLASALFDGMMGIGKNIKKKFAS
jgi:glycosyltransferase involved in cell wall biosynthesis